MSEKTFYISEVDGDTDFQHVTLDILSEPICMNLGVAFMPFMNEEFHFLDDEISLVEGNYGLNEVELDFVKYLYTIRECNRENKTILYSMFSGPDIYYKRERIFLAGKIFPVMSISYNKKNINCATSRMKFEPISDALLKIPFPYTYKIFDNRYLSIDNGGIRIFLPKYSAMKIDYGKLLLNFLTNSKDEKIIIATVNGEFPNMEIYRMATGNFNLQKACWLTEDRKKKSDRWKTACMHIVENKYQGVLGPFSQIADFYQFLKIEVADSKHKTRWLIGAHKLVDALTMLDGGHPAIANDVEVILSELNLGICDYAITQFYELFFGKYKNDPRDTLEKAYKWDVAFVTYEQGTVAKPIYEKTSQKTLDTFQAMADRDASWNPRNAAHGTGAWFMKQFIKVVPEFDAWDAKVTDAQFRIDLPLLMLWLDRHKPKSDQKSDPFYNKVDENRYLLEEEKEKIRDYAVK